MREESWVLGVDESGRMRAGDGLVGGVLLRVDDTVANAQVLRDRLLELVPGVPWPLHATDLRRPATHALAWFAPQKRRVTLFAEDEGRCAKAVDLIECSEHPVLKKAVDDARAGRWGKIDFKAVDRALIDDAPASRGPLRALATDRFVRLGRFVGSLSEELGTDGCFGLLAAGPDDGALGVPVPGGIGSDRYLALLEVLFERMLLLHCVTDVHRTVHVRVATRYIEEKLGARRGFPLRAQDWLALFQRAAEGVETRLGARARRPRVIAPEIVTKYDQNVHPVVVLADLLANSSLSMVRQERLSHRTFEGHVRRRAGLALRAPAESLSSRPVLSAVAAGGSFRAAVDAAMAGGPSVPFGERPRWAGEQAAEWIAAAEQDR